MPQAPFIPTPSSPHHLGFTTFNISNSLLMTRELNLPCSGTHCFSPRNKPAN